MIRDYVIQIRASGVRVKRKTTAPSLVAMTATQVPIIGWEGRYMTPLECKRLQSMDKLDLPARNTKAYAGPWQCHQCEGGSASSQSTTGYRGQGCGTEILIKWSGRPS